MSIILSGGAKDHKPKHMNIGSGQSQLLFDIHTETKCPVFYLFVVQVGSFTASYLSVVHFTCQG